MWVQFWESQPPYASCVEHTKHMHALGEPYTALCGLEGEPAPVHQPGGLTLWDRQHQIRPAPRQGRQAISRTGEERSGRYRGDTGAGVEGDENQLHGTMDCTVKNYWSHKDTKISDLGSLN